MEDHKRVTIDASSAMLLIIDVQKETDKFIRGGVFKAANPDHERKKEIVPIIHDLAERARAAGVRVVYTQSIRNGSEAEFTTFGRVPVLQVGTWHADMHDDLKPEEWDIVVRKWVPDPWYETDMERVMRGLYPDPTNTNVLVTGGSITGCAYFGIVGLLARDYRMTIVADAIYGPVGQALKHFGRTTYPTYPSIALSRSDLITFAKASDAKEITSYKHTPRLAGA